MGNADDLCLQFYYHMRGDDVGYLRVLWSATYYETQEMIRIVGDQGDQWLPASVDLTSLGGDFQVSLGLFNPGFSPQISRSTRHVNAVNNSLLQKNV